MESKRILFVTQEITPYLPETEISVISRKLPQAIQERGREIRTFMPKFGNVNDRRNQLHEVIRLSGMNLIINDNDHPLIIKVASIQSARMQIYFIDNEDYFQKRLIVTDEEGNEYPDNHERSVFFNRGTIETVRKLRWVPDVIHCHGWFAALQALFVKVCYYDDPCFKNSKIILSLYDDEFKNPLPNDFGDAMRFGEITDEHVAPIAGKEVTHEEFYKFVMKYCDGLIQNSERVNTSIVDYAKELGLPVLEYQGKEDYADAFNAFYDVVLEGGK